MKLAIIGAGTVGAALGTRFRDAGHSVQWGVPNPTDAKYEKFDPTDVASAAAGAEVVVLAVPWAAAMQALKSAGNLTGKILIDVTNPIANDFSDLVDLENTSGAEQVAAWAGGASVVKAFNTIGSNVMENAQFGQHRANVLVAADDAGAKATVLGLARDIGFDPVDAGPLRMARHLESFAWVWITLAMKQGMGREIVFQLLQR